MVLLFINLLYFFSSCCECSSNNKMLVL